MAATTRSKLTELVFDAIACPVVIVGARTDPNVVWLLAQFPPSTPVTDVACAEDGDKLVLGSSLHVICAASAALVRHDTSRTVPLWIWTNPFDSDEYGVLHLHIGTLSNSVWHAWVDMACKADIVLVIDYRAGDGSFTHTLVAAVGA